MGARSLPLIKWVISECSSHAGWELTAAAAGTMGGPAPAVAAPDATCTLLPLTSFPKNKIKVLLLENISHTAIEMFESERFQIVRPLATLAAPYCLYRDMNDLDPDGC